jgi:ABC-type multidrug transport system permease subunit
VLIVIYLLCLKLFRERESFNYSDVFIDCIRMFDSGRYVVVFCVFAAVLVFFVHSLYGVTGMVDL